MSGKHFERALITFLIGDCLTHRAKLQEGRNTPYLKFQGTSLRIVECWIFHIKYVWPFPTIGEVYSNEMEKWQTPALQRRVKTFHPGAVGLRPVASDGFENRRTSKLSEGTGGGMETGNTGASVIDFAYDTDWTGLRNWTAFLAGLPSTLILFLSPAVLHYCLRTLCISPRILPMHAYTTIAWGL